MPAVSQKPNLTKPNIMVNIYLKTGVVYQTLLFLFLLVIGRPVKSQTDTLISLSGGRMTNEEISHYIAQQTGLGLQFDSRRDAKRSIYVPKGMVPLRRLLKYCLRPLNLIYRIDGKTIWTSPRPPREKDAPEPIIDFRLKVVGDGERLAEATVEMDGANYYTGADGTLVILAYHVPVALYITHVGYQAETLIVNESKEFIVNMRRQDTYLDELIVRGYFSESRRTSTGSVVDIGTQTLDRHISGGNLPSFWAGRAAGLQSIQTSGVIGASHKIWLRGRMSILNGRDLLYVIDGIPYGPGNQSLGNNPAGNSAGSLDPLSLVPFEDIENIKVLKDADATAIYGSRGANGVMLITTRRGSSGRCQVTAHVGSGYSQVTTRPALLDMHGYSAMRRDALRNDNLPVDGTYAPELALWDTARHTDWGKWAIGGLGYRTNAHISAAGGTNSNGYYAGLTTLRETNVFVTHPVHLVLALNGRYSYYSERFNMEITGLVTRDKNQQLTEDVTRTQFLAPNTPGPWGKDGEPIFQSAGYHFTSPVYYTGKSYDAVSWNMLMGGSASYKLSKSLIVRLNTGLNDVLTGEYSANPSWIHDPATNPRGSSYSASTKYRSWIGEPQIEYTWKKRRWTFSALAGGTWQELHTSVGTITGNGFSNDASPGRPESADTVSRQDTGTSYRYTSLFGRWNVSWKKKYILNFTDRWDGSSRFTESQRYGNFWAAGLAWVFSEEAFCRKYLPFVNFGKLRASYGVTGNDQIGGGPRYLETWAPGAAITFQNTPGTVSPGKLNPSISWERVKKMEVAMDGGFANNRWLLTAVWYRYRSDHQLLPDKLPFSGNFLHLINVPAVLECSGWEFSVMSRNIDGGYFGWTTTLNVSIPRSRLLTLGGYTAGNFSKELVPGKPLSTLRAYHYVGIDPQTGLYQVEDRNNDGKYNSADRIVAGSPDVTCFGGIENIVRWKQWELAVQIEGRVQKGIRYQLAILNGNAPGSLQSGVYSNQLAGIASRWRKSGDNGVYQILSSGNEALDAISRYASSDGILTDASFARIKTLTLSYEWRVRRHKMNIAGMKMTLQAQNLFTLTPYRDGDPEIQSAVTMPPLRTIVAGLQVKF